MGNSGSLALRDVQIPETYPFMHTIRSIVNMHRFMEFLLELSDYAWQTWGKKTFIIKLLGHPIMVMTRDIENITYILKTNFENYPKGPVMKYRFRALLGDGIFNAE
jgi:hypothetical protein